MESIVSIAYNSAHEQCRVRLIRNSITSYNVVFAVLAMFILLVKSFLYIMDLFWPLLALLTHMLLVVLASVSIYNQAGADYSDPEHPSRVPWYITRGCGAPVRPGLHGYCLQAKSSFAVACCLLYVLAAAHSYIHSPFKTPTMYIC